MLQAVDESEGEFELQCERSLVCVKSQHLEESARCVCVGGGVGAYSESTHTQQQQHRLFIHNVMAVKDLRDKPTPRWTL